MQALTYRQLLPRSGVITASRLVSSLELGHPDERLDRPYTIANFVLSADGRSVVNGQSRALSDSGDRDLFRTLRERVDAVLAGPATLAAEQYGRMLPASERRERRLAAGRSAEPLAITISRSGRLPLDIPLFGEPEATVVVFSPASSASFTSAATIRHEPLDSSNASDLAAMLRTLKRSHGVATLLCEGGPTLLGALLHANLVDELFLTVAPALVGGQAGPAVVSGPPLELPVQLTLVGLLERESTLFMRYAL